MDTKSIIDLLSFIASIASLILAVVAIWLSIVFYRLSTAASEATTEASKGIQASVERLEKLFDKLYSDTFSMMRETVTDMRKHMWPEEDAEQEKASADIEGKTDQRLQELQRNMERQLSGILAGQRIAEEKNLALQTEMRELLGRAIRTSKQVEEEVRDETVRERLLSRLRSATKRGLWTEYNSLIHLDPMISPNRAAKELSKLREEGVLEFVPDAHGAGARVRLANKHTSTSILP